MEKKTNQESCKKLGDVFSFFSRYTEEEGGMIKLVQSESDNWSIVVFVDSVDFYKEYMADFIQCLSEIDEFHITNTGDDSLEIRIIVRDTEVENE